jgi:Fasciclin domain.
MVKVNDGQVIKADILGSNGVIHVVDTVLTPLDSCAKYQ